MSKKFFALLLVVLLIVSLVVGCGGQKPKEEAVEKPEEKVAEEPKTKYPERNINAVVGFNPAALQMLSPGHIADFAGRSRCRHRNN